MAREIFVKQRKLKTIAIKAPEDTVDRLEDLRQRIKKQSVDLDFNFDAVVSDEIEKIVRQANRYLDKIGRPASLDDESAAARLQIQG